MPAREEQLILADLERLPGNRWLWLLAPVVLLVPLLLPISGELRFHALWGVMGKRLHIVIFALLTLWLSVFSPFRMRWSAAAVTAMFIGAGVELLQSVLGRTASLMDLVYNAIGVGFGLALIAWWNRRREVALLLAVPLALVVLYQLRELPRDYAVARYAHSRFPLIADFDSEILDHTWEPFFGAEMEYVSSEDAGGAGSRVLLMRFPAGDSWPGVATQCFPLDWTGRGCLLADIRIAEGRLDTLAMGVRLEDAGFLRDGDYHSDSFMVSKAWSSVRIGLGDARTRKTGRPLNLERMITLKFFIRQPDQEGAIEIDNVRLE